MIARKVKKGKEEVFEALGCCIRTDYGLWVPAHVLGYDFENLYVLGRRMSRQNKEGELEYYIPSIPLRPYYDKVLDDTQFGAEMISIPLSPADYSQLALTIAKFTNLSQKGLVTIVGPQGKSSMGELTPGAILGTVKYGGSTMGGFSGAPYMLDGKVVGIHLHGGAGGNGGQEALYLSQMYKIERKIEEESAGAGLDTGAKILALAFRAKKDIRYEELADYVIFRDESGYYHRAKKETFYNLQANSKSYQNQDLDYDQYDSDEESRYGGDPDEWDKYWKKGKYAEQAKKLRVKSRYFDPTKRTGERSKVLYKPESTRESEEQAFLYQASSNSPKRKPTQRKEKSPELIQALFLKYGRLLEQQQSGKKPAACPPQTQPQPGPSTASPSN